MIDKNVPESVLGLIRKVKELAERGIGGEAETAKQKLLALLAKHKLTLEDVTDGAVRTFTFKYSSEDDKNLLHQIYLSLGVDKPGIWKLKDWRGRVKKQSGLDLTPQQYIDLCERLEYYRSALKTEKKRLFMAFIHKHNLFAPDAKVPDKPTLSPEELRKLISMIRGLQEKSFARPAGLLTELAG